MVVVDNMVAYPKVGEMADFFRVFLLAMLAAAGFFCGEQLFDCDYGQL